MALGYLLLLFVILLMVSIIGISLLFGVKDPQGNTIIFIAIVLLSILISYISVTSLPSNYMVIRIIARTFGFLSIIGIVLRIVKKSLEANLLVTASVVFGLILLCF